MTCEYLTLDERLELDSLRTKDAENIEKMNNMQTEIDDKNNEIATLNIERENLEKTNEELNSQIKEYTAKIEELVEYKTGIETIQKNAMIDRYSEKLPAEITNKYRFEINTYTLDNLEKELAYELVKNDSTILSSQSDDQYIPSESTPTGLAALLSKYQK
jgi:predicted  nucleic acid-binding Zn-ribbon protein